MRRFALALLVCLAASVLTACRSATTVYVVRHAERADVTAAEKDPPLTDAGLLRAEALAAVTSGAGVSEIYVTQFRRTQQTAQPTATALGLTPLVFTVAKDTRQHARDLVADILARHTGGTVLVVGHSDTVPLIVAELGGPAPVLGPAEFGRLFVVERRDDGTVYVTDSHYGP